MEEGKSVKTLLANVGMFKVHGHPDTVGRSTHSCNKIQDTRYSHNSWCFDISGSAFGTTVKLTQKSGFESFWGHN